jgi:predicted HicB family RNase H-like nuclease
MNIMTYNGYAATTEFDADDVIFVGRIAGISDIVGFHASDAQGLVEAFHEAVDDYLKACEKAGRPPQKPYSGKMMLRVKPLIHARAALAAELAGKSLNAWSEEALATATERSIGGLMHP